jgi:K+-sensing histidine kinase KdpD
VRGVPGSGLGLAIARSLVERHAGSIQLESRSGGGAVFRVRLPARPGPRCRDAVPEFTSGPALPRPPGAGSMER